MITYDKTDIDRLADLYDETLPPSTPEMDEYGKITYHDTVDDLFKESNNVEQILLDFLGLYLCAANDEQSFQVLYAFLFMLPFNEIMLYAGDNTWKGMVAKWRIELEK